MAVVAYFGLLLLLALTPHSSATYCLCNSGLNDTVLQKDIVYACAAGADCTAILQSGACYSPNTVKAHCDYAVNSFFQRKAQAVGSCYFSGTAAISPTGPTSVASGCIYQSSPSSTTPSTTPPSTGTGTGTGTGTTTPSTTTPSTGTGTGTGTGTTTPSTTTPSSTIPSPSAFNGLGPSSTGIDNSSGATKLGCCNNLFVSFVVSSMTLWSLGLIWWG